MTPRQLASFAGFYLFYYGFLGIFSPYWGPYLKSLAVPMAMIGLLTSLPQINRIYAPALWGWLADYTGRRTLILRVAGLGGLAGMSILLFTRDFVWMFVAVFVSSFFWSAALPQVEAAIIAFFQGDNGKYSRLRIFGSLGFMFATLIGGYLVEGLGVAVLPAAVVTVMACVMLFAWLTPTMPARTVSREKVAGMMEILRRREVQAVFLSCFLMGAAHGVLQSFYSIHVEEHGIAKSAMGWLWSAGIVAEIIVFWQMPRLSSAFGLKPLFLFGMAVAVVRYATIAFVADVFWLLFIAQIGHAFTFGSNHAVTMSYLHRHFGQTHQTKGQALYIVLAFGVGGSVGGLASGLLWDAIGGTGMFMLASLASLIALIATWRGIADDSKLITDQ